VEKVVKRVSLGEGERDVRYWRTRPYSERLMALEEIRRSYIRWRYGAEPRLQRVYKIVKR